METITKIITIIGAVMVVSGLFWGLMGTYEFFRGRSTGDKNRQADGMESLINGAALAAISGGIAAAIVAALNAIQF